MDRIFKGLPFVFIYLDDILVASRGRGLHLKHLRVVLELLVQNGLVINLDKCSFALPEIDYLGHKITATGIVPLRRHVEALLQQPHPQDVCSLQRFLGMVNFYRRFLPGIAKILRPLTNALAGNPKSLNWSETHQESFEKAKSALVWRGLANDVRDLCRACLSCQRGKVLRHVQLRPEKGFHMFMWI